MNQRTQFSETQEDILSQWIKNQPLYRNQVNKSNAGLLEQQVEAIIAIRKRISAQTNH